MDSSARPLPAGLPQPGNTQLAASSAQAKAKGPVDPVPLAKVRQELPAEPAAATLPLREKAIALGSRSDVKSSSVAPADSRTPASRPGLRQMAELGARAAQSAKASGEYSATPSTWFVALNVLGALPDLYRFGSDLRGPGFRVPPQDSDEPAMTRQAIASLALDPSAPLPTGEALVDRLMELSVPAGEDHDDLADSLWERLDGIEVHLNALAVLLEDPVDKQAPARRALTRLDALDQEIRSLLADSGAGVPATLRAELTKLGERVESERGFVQRAEAFAKAHDTGNLNFGGLVAYMRHGTTTQQLRFLLFEQSVDAAFRASFVKGAPVEIPSSVVDSYEDLWQQVARSGRPEAARTE